MNFKLFYVEKYISFFRWLCTMNEIDGVFLYVKIKPIDVIVENEAKQEKSSFVIISSFFFLIHRWHNLNFFCQYKKKKRKAKRTNKAQKWKLNFLIAKSLIFFPFYFQTVFQISNHRFLNGAKTNAQITCNQIRLNS